MMKIPANRSVRDAKRNKPKRAILVMV